MCSSRKGGVSLVMEMKRGRQERVRVVYTASCAEGLNYDRAVSVSGGLWITLTLMFMSGRTISSTIPWLPAFRLKRWSCGAFCRTRFSPMLGSAESEKSCSSR